MASGGACVFLEGGGGLVRMLCDNVGRVVVSAAQYRAQLRYLTRGTCLGAFAHCAGRRRNRRYRVR